jgi:hypothetical protein
MWGRVARFERTLRLGAAALGAVSLALAAAPAREALAGPAYTTVPGPYRPDVRFVVRYRGLGVYETVFHAEPPNPGGADDTNDAHDFGAQAWILKFRDRLGLPPCGPAADGGPDACEGLAGLSGATGATAVLGQVRHKHVDGLYRELDRVVRCTLRSGTPDGSDVEASVGIRYLPGSRGIGVTAQNPVATALSLFPAQCPGGESIDRILDFYATPGFSFDPHYDPDRWFTSREVVIPAAVFHRSRKIAIPLSDHPAGRPPRGCAVRDPSFERCRTGGAWGGVLTFARSSAST